jgi:uncharacterized protein
MAMKCPRCGKKIESSGNQFRPFCSDRCKLLDLGDWISGGYKIPGNSAVDEDNIDSMKEEDPDKE